MRNRRVIDEIPQRKWPKETEIHNTWLSVINNRVTLDAQMTHTKYEKKALSKKIVICTWSGTLQNEKDLPKDWTRTKGILVGISRHERAWRGRRAYQPP